jgi:hypothetical protein
MMVMISMMVGPMIQCQEPPNVRGTILLLLLLLLEKFIMCLASGCEMKQRFGIIQIQRNMPQDICGCYI